MDKTFVITVYDENDNVGEHWRRSTIERARVNASVASVHWGVPAYIWYDGTILEVYENGEPCTDERIEQLINADFEEEPQDDCDDDCDSYAELGYNPYVGCCDWDC